MKINSKDFRVREGEEVNLKKWPTKVDPVYKSKEQYQKLLEEHVAQLSSQQQLLYASNRYALLLIFQAMDAAGKDGAIKPRYVRGQSPRLPGVQLQASKPDGTATRLSLAHHPRSAGTRADRHLQSILLRGGADRPRAPRNSPQRRTPGRAAHDKKVWHDRYRSIVDLERHLHGNGTRIIKFFLHLSKEEQRKRFPGAHRRTGKELEIQPRGHCREEILEAVHEGL